MTRAPYIFYGIELSLYAGKVRSYLRKKHLPFVERGTDHPGFPAAAARVGREVQPLVETPEGELLQDTTEIIDFLEVRHPEPSVYPAGPRQRLVALLFELFGDEGLMKPAMHYRWNFPQENDAFLSIQFAHARPVPDGESAETMVAALQQFMRGHALGQLGVTPASEAVIEQAYEELLDCFERHFREFPYLLGGRPSIGDFGLMAPLYAHLGRDPYPASLMKRRAPHLYRWVERMNTGDAGMAEFPNQPEDYLADDVVPGTLFPVLRLMAQDYMPELLGITASVDSWLQAHPEIEAASVVPASSAGMGTISPLGMHKVVFRGVEIELAVHHYSLWMLGRVQKYYDQLSQAERGLADGVLAEAGLTPLISARTSMRIERHNFQEVFA
ncbi:MAG: glutathione S-transferase [Halieaceae bacterium]|nr:glutathione S-transferase [Halieaceae bacterium]